MKKLLITLFLINSLSLNYTLYAATESKVEHFLETHKTYRAFDKIALTLPRQVQQFLAQRLELVPSEHLHVFQEISEILMASAHRSSQDTDFRLMMKEELINNFSDNEIDAIQKWYDSDIGQRAWQFELDSVRPVGSRIMV